MQCECVNGWLPDANEGCINAQEQMAAMQTEAATVSIVVESSFTNRDAGKNFVVFVSQKINQIHFNFNC